MAVWPEQKEIDNLKDKVFWAVSYNKPEVIQECLASLHPQVVKDILHHRHTGKKSQSTPLIIAASRGYLKVVELLVNEFNVDVSQEVPCTFRNHCALHTAVYHGHLDIVTVLVRKGCDISAKCKHGTTPVAVACLQNHPSILKYLVENGGQIDDHFSKDNVTCLIMACWAANLEMVDYLLSKGADPNKEDIDKRTALHIAAERNESEIVTSLLQHGGRLSRDRNGFTPLMAAALQCAGDAVNAFLQSTEPSQVDRAEALELFGARIAEVDHDEAFLKVRQAMEERYKNPGKVLLKPHSPLPILDNVQESQTLAELLARQSNRHLFRLECLAILSRILGPESTVTVDNFASHFRHLKIAGRHEEATAVWLHAMRGIVKGDRYPAMVHHDMSLFSANFAAMLSKGLPGFFRDVEEVTELFLQRMEKNRKLFENLDETRDTNWLFYVLIALKVVQGQEEGRRLQRLVERFTRLTSGTPVLHTAVSCHWRKPGSVWCVDGLPFDSLVSFLLHCGADVHFKDDKKDTALHIAARLSLEEENTELFKNIAKRLVRAGALVGVKNIDGKTPLDLAGPTLAAELRGLYPVSLKSLAATAVVCHKVPYATEVPEDLKDFVDKH